MSKQFSRNFSIQSQLDTGGYLYPFFFFFCFFYLLSSVYILVIVLLFICNVLSFFYIQHLSTSYHTACISPGNSLYHRLALPLRKISPINPLQIMLTKCPRNIQPNSIKMTCQNSLDAFAYIRNLFSPSLSLAVFFYSFLPKRHLCNRSYSLLDFFFLFFTWMFIFLLSLVFNELRFSTIVLCSLLRG